MSAANHKTRIFDTLQSLREFALQQTAGKDIAIGLQLHEEDSSLMRFANSAISLNTNEHLIRLTIEAIEGRKRASYELITDLGQMETMKNGIDSVIQLVKHAQPLSYQPTIPVLKETFIDETSYDETLAKISNAERLAYFNQVASGLETDDVRLSGIFSNGATTLASIWTTSEDVLYFKFSDTQITSVMASASQKWEVIAEASAQRKADLDAGCLNQDLSTMIAQLKSEAPFQLPLGRYDVVFGPAAIAEMVHIMRWIGFNGGTMKRGYSFLNESLVGQKVLSNKFSLYDDPSRRETYPFRRDAVGMVRQTMPLFGQGVFKGFIYPQDDADEFGVLPTGHTISHMSLVMSGGEQASADTLQDLMRMPRERDLLYIPYLHYMNIVNPSKGVITASSRFGTRLLRKDGTVGIPFNVRVTQSLLDIFGDKIDWLSRQTTIYNVSSSYGRRNPDAVIVPTFMRVNDLEISQSNAAY